MTRRIAHAAPLVALVLCLALVPAAVAAKGGAGGNGSSTGGSGVVFTFDPATVSVGQTYQVDVSGLRANTWTNIGAADTTLIRMTTGYAEFANGGKKINATLIDRIQDRNGRDIYRHDPRACDGCNGRWHNCKLTE